MEGLRDYNKKGSVFMNVLFIVLNKVEYLEEILDMFMEIGVRGATILDSQGMGRAIGETDAFFGAIRNMIDGARPYNKTIFTVIEDKETLDRAIKETKNIVGEISDPGVGMMFTLPIGEVHGMAR